MSVNVFSTKVLIGDTIVTSPTGDGTAILHGHPSHVKVYQFAWQRQYLHFSVILQRAKKVLSDSPGLVDFAIGLVNSVFNLPDGQVMFYEEFE